MTDTSRRSWLGFLTDRDRSAAETAAEGDLWRAHRQSQQGAIRLVESSAQVLAGTARQQSVIDRIVEHARNATNRGAEIQEPMDRLSTALERLRLVALNIGLEGARIGDTAGRALINVADEVRGSSERGVEALADLRTAIEDVDSTWEQLRRCSDELRDSHGSIVTQVGHQQTLAQQVVRDVDSVGEHARRMSATDPETALILAEAGEHARALVRALTSLGGKVRRELVRSALGPSLQPLLRVLLDLARRGGKSGE